MYMYILCLVCFCCRFRRLCYKTVCLKSFQTITFTAVFISSLLLTIEVPIGADVNSAILCTLQVRGGGGGEEGGGRRGGGIVCVCRF